MKRSTPPPFTLFNYTTTVLTFISVAKAKKDTIATTGPIPTYPKGKEQNPTTSNTAERDSRTLGSAWGGAFGGEEVNSHTRQKGKEEITQKDLQFFRASPHAPEWSGNIHESKLSDIHRPTLARLPMGRLKSYKYKKSAYGGKKSPARAGEKEISP